MNKHIRTLSIAILLGSFALLSACNTVKGFGKDVQKVGEEVEDTAQEVQN